MSKGSNFWGTARGKIGNMVISSVKGQQVERKYQPQVANPKTLAQMRQRAVFASAVKFFKHSQQNLFQFAYEDKLQKESDYNAFMRHNVSCFAPVNKSACNNPTLPALGFNLRLQLSFGSLPSPNNLQWFDDTKLFCFDCGSIDSATPNKYSWGEVSKAIAGQYGLANGDIVTFVVIGTELSPNEFGLKYFGGTIASAASTPAKWTITQRQLDTESVEDVTSFVHNDKYFGVKVDGDVRDTLYFGGIIFSRNTQGRSLMVSTSTLSCSQPDNYLEKIPASGSDMEKYTLFSWGANDEAILKGALL